MSDHVVIQDKQITSITKRGIHYTDDAGNEHFIDFDACYQEIIEMFHHPNVRKMNMQPRYQSDYLALLDTLKIKKIVGFLSPNGGVLTKTIGIPTISIGGVQIKFVHRKDYVALREKILIRDIHFIIRFLDIV